MRTHPSGRNSVCPVRCAHRRVHAVNDPYGTTRAIGGEGPLNCDLFFELGSSTRSFKVPIVAPSILIVSHGCELTGLRSARQRTRVPIGFVVLLTEGVNTVRALWIRETQRGWRGRRDHTRATRLHTTPTGSRQDFVKIRST